MKFYSAILLAAAVLSGCKGTDGGQELPPDPVAPQSVYLSGNASREGSRKMLPLGGGKFVTYTRIGNGTLYFDTAKGGGDRLLIHKVTSAPESGIARLTFFTADNTVEIAAMSPQVKCVSTAGEDLATLEYVAQGRFSGSATLTLPANTTYRFIATIGGTGRYWLPSEGMDVQETESATAFDGWTLTSAYDNKKLTFTVHTDKDGVFTHEFSATDPEGPEPPGPEISHKQKAAEFFQTIKDKYEIRSGSGKGFFNEHAGDGSISFLWCYDGIVSGIACLSRLGVEIDYAGYLEKYQRYYRSSGVENVGGYGSSTDGTSGGGDRFYDDNSIVGMNLVEAYHQTSDRKYLERCAQIVSFLRSGEDSVFGGGLWWNESHKNDRTSKDSNKPCCANSYAAWFLTMYYDVCPESEKAEVLSFAKRLYSFLYTTLRDPSDNLYWNSKEVDGSINTSKWTYNTGAMVAAGARLYTITGEEHYLTEAKASADAAYSHFVHAQGGPALNYPDHDPWFNVKLFRAYIEFEPLHEACTEYIEVFIDYLDYALEHSVRDNGLFYENWLGYAAQDPDRDNSLLTQDAVLEALGLTAIYKNEQ